jgi:hypothetical protein
MYVCLECITWAKESRLWVQSLNATCYLWGNLKDKVNRTSPHNKEDLKEDTQREIFLFPQKELQGNSCLPKQYRECVHVQRQYFQHLLYYKSVDFIAFVEQYFTSIRKVMFCLVVSHAAYLIHS